MKRSMIAAFLVAVSATMAIAQGCAPATTFLKNDNLPAVPSGPLAVSVIPGLCEGEAIGAIFDVSSIGSVVRIDNAAVGYFNNAGANGIQAAVNLQIYDGVTFSGTTPVLGPLVFDFGVATNASVGVTSTAINVVDISSFNVNVTSGKMVVVWEMDFNVLGGTCATGYTTNFGTDNPSLTSVCTTPSQKNLVRITGQGWRDVRFATVSGFPLCPFFINGNWVIRACARDVTPVNPLTINFFPSAATTAGGLTLVQFVGTPADGGKIYIPVISCTLGSTPIPGTTLSLPFLIDVCSNYYLNDLTFSVFALTPPPNKFGFLLPNGTASGTVSIPLNVVAPPGGIPIHFCWALLNGPTIEGISQLKTLTIN